MVQTALTDLNISNYVLIPVIILVITILSAIFCTAHKHKKGIFTPTNILFGGVFITSVLLFFPVYLKEFSVSDNSIVAFSKSFLTSIHNAIRLFMAGSEYEYVTDKIIGNSGNVTTAFSFLCAFIFVLAPLLTFSFILSFFKNLSAYRRYLFSFGRDAYIFSELNENSLELARSIRLNHKNAAIIFTSVSTDKDSNIAPLREELSELCAIAFASDLLSVRFDFHSKSKRLVFITVSESSETLTSSLSLIRKYGKRKNTELFAFSSDVEGELLLNAAKKNLNMKVRRIDPIRSFAYNLADKHGEKIFHSAIPTSNGKKLISAVIVGMGKYGFEMAKLLSWLCQMHGYDLKINIFDADKNAKEFFQVRCPELINEGDGYEENTYDITVHPDIITGTARFEEEFCKLGAISYIFVAQGDDSKNIETAVYLRGLSGRQSLNPLMHAIVRDPEKNALLQGICNFENPPRPYDIDFIGSLSSIYSEDAIFSTELEERALARHLRYGDEESFWSYEYNYRSSMASAIHLDMRRRLKIPGADKSPEARTEEERELLRRLEHRRWNAYTRSEGYIKGPKNHITKTHPTLVAFDELSPENQQKDDA